MRFWLSLVTNTEPDQLPAIARHAEEVGFHGVTVPDHLVMSTRIESKYPYTEDGKIWWPDDLPWLDPWVALSAMGAVTSRLKLATNIYLAGLRDPFTPAKAVSSAAAIAPGASCAVFPWAGSARSTSSPVSISARVASGWTS
jgi:alkanesulfonate monooxygenase SsuD/methylene tetrahydromethanopterin reductase-like flavin-dependent oxidoreductase (luciferase family)